MARRNFTVRTPTGIKPAPELPVSDWGVVFYDDGFILIVEGVTFPELFEFMDRHYSGREWDLWDRQKRHPGRLTTPGNRIEF